MLYAQIGRPLVVLQDAQKFLVPIKRQILAVHLDGHPSELGQKNLKVGEMFNDG